MKCTMIDANVVLRFLTADLPEQSSRCRDLWARVQDGQEEIYLPEVVLSEIAWTLRSFYRWPVERIAHFVGELLALKHLQTPRKALLLDALRLYATQRIDWSDALIAAEALREGFAVYSYDRDLDNVSGLQRMEP